MKTTTIIWGSVIGLALIISLWGFSTYNSLVKANLAVDTQWAQVEAQYQRRFDLIPSLVASVQGIFDQEKSVFGDIAKARQGYAGAKTVDEKAQAASQMEGALGRLLVITENYPQLASSQTVQNLMTQLEGTENRVSTERGRFNESVSTLNAKVLSFPTNIFSKMFGFNARTFFKATEQASVAPVVEFKK
ncbi:MAG: LemA family protein [Candidatus Paceibacterota bacterium]